jgi:hypothetical protein
MIAARALFAFLRGPDRRPTEPELLGAVLVSEAIDCLRTLVLIERERIKAARKRRR